MKLRVVWPHLYASQGQTYADAKFKWFFLLSYTLATIRPLAIFALRLFYFEFAITTSYRRYTLTPPPRCSKYVHRTHNIVIALS